MLDTALTIVKFALMGVRVYVVVFLAANGKSLVLRVHRYLEGMVTDSMTLMPCRPERCTLGM